MIRLPFEAPKIGRKTIEDKKSRRILLKTAKNGFPVGRFCYFCSKKSNYRVMTTFALNNLWSYLQGLMLTQSEREWLAEKLSEPVEKTTTEVNGEEQVNQVLKDLVIPDKLRRKRGCIKLTEEDLKDERIQYLLNQ
jgi:hypothetical protein